MNGQKKSLYLLLAVGACSIAKADDVVHRLSEISFGTPQWHFHPVHNPETGLVDALVAIAKPDATIGDNLNTVMFIRNGNQFEAWSWRDATRARAVYSAKMILNVSDDDDWRWTLDEPLPWLDDNALRPPTPYDAGMLTDDPLFEPVMESDNPQALIDFLTSIGYSATSLRIGDGGGDMDEPPDEGCEVLLLSLAGATEWGLTQPMTDDDLVEAACIGVSSMITSNCGGGCTPGTPTGDPDVETDNPPVCTWKFLRDDVQGTEHNCIYEIKKTYSKTRTRKMYDANCNKQDCVSKKSGYTTNGVEMSCGPVTSPCNKNPGGSVCSHSASADGFCSTAGAPPATGDGKWTRWFPGCGD